MLVFYTIQGGALEPLIEVKHLSKCYGSLHAVDDISFQIFPSETLGLVGESGSGKSTTGRCLLRLEEPTEGQLFFKGHDLLALRRKELFAFRRGAQIIFQDPYSSLNPRMTAADLLLEPLLIHKVPPRGGREVFLRQLLERVGLPSNALSRFPHEFSGGQRQRIGIARALALNPSFIVCDEPISALDVSVQAQIVNLLKSLQKELGLTYLFIAHDLAMVKYISHRVAVMYLGNLVEIAPSEELYRSPLHPYTQTLLASIPEPDPHKERAKQHASAPIDVKLQILKEGCPFAPRCPHATSRCWKEKPKMQEVSPGHLVSCFLSETHRQEPDRAPD